MIARYLGDKLYPDLCRYLDRISVKQLSPGLLLERIEEMRLATYEQGRADMRGKILDAVSGWA